MSIVKMKRTGEMVGRKEYEHVQDTTGPSALEKNVENKQHGNEVKSTKRLER